MIKMKGFNELGLDEGFLSAVKEQGFENPTTIQEMSIPVILQGKDVIGLSSTGSGKTLAFSTGIVNRCERARGPQALVLTPTRELAKQVQEEIKKYAKPKKLRTTVIYGGVSIEPQIKQLRDAEIIIGTPGRLLDHMQRQTIDLSHVNVLVLDEADIMIDMGFLEDVEKIISQCPKDRQTLMFSATMPVQLMDIAKRYMKKPEEVGAESYVDPKKLKQVYYDVPHPLKISLLVHLLKTEKGGLVLVFCNSRRTVDYVESSLKANTIRADAIHGGLSQSRRESIMKNFKSKDVYVLVCTDVAARGLDIPGVSHVYNYDIPLDSKQYVHRIGRTARAGKDGKAINILSDRDHENFDRVLRDNDVDIQNVEMPYVEKAVRPKTTPLSGKRTSGRGPGNRGGRPGNGRRGSFGRGGRGRKPNSGNSRGGPQRKGSPRPPRRNHTHQNN